MDINMPNVVTTLRNKEQNFIFHVKAYRKLSNSEMEYALSLWMKQKNLKTIPKNK